MPTRLRYLLSLLIALNGIIGPLQLVVAREPVCSAADIHPAFPPVNATPAVEVADANNAAPPSGATCFADSNKGATWITVSSAIQTALSPEAIIQRFGAISALQTVQYWSTTDQAWRPLVSAAFAVNATDANQPRADYGSAELVGSPRFYRVTDTRTYDPVNYSLEIHPAPHGQILAETTNIDPIKKWGITLYRRDGLHTLYFLNERSPGVWSYYSITRVVPATFLARGHEKSYVNRAIALYRHYLRLPTTADPPAAR
jgi:hypothetical protein